MNECNNDICDNNIPIIDLSKFDKNKSWIMFYLNTCSTCHIVIEYFKKNNFKFKAYDLDTSEGMSIAAYYDVVKQCEKFVPVIVLDEE